MLISLQDLLSLQLWSLFKGKQTPEDGRERVRIHLESGANPNIVYGGVSVLHLSAAKPVSWLDILLEYGANPHIQDKNGGSPIHSIPEVNSFLPKAAQVQAAADAILRLNKLRAYGAILDAQDFRGFTPLIYACLLKDEETVKVLEEEGANINARCHLGRTPLIYAITPANITSRAMPSSVERVKGTQIASFLVGQGVDLNIRCNSGRTALHYVLDNMSSYEGPTMGIKKLFLERGAKTNIQDCTGRTPLHCAAETPGNGLFISLLVESGANVNQRQNDGVTALEIAARLEASNSSVIRYLIRHGAECDMKDPTVKRRVLRAQRWLKISGQL